MKLLEKYSGLGSLIFWLLFIVGWFMNIYKLTKYDFDTPLKAEATRILGAVVAPLGAVMGFIDIDDDKN